MSNYLESMKRQQMGRLTHVVGAQPSAPKFISKMLDEAKSQAPLDIKDGIGTLVGGIAGALYGRKRGHMVLGIIGGASLGRNGLALMGYQRNIAIRNIAITGAGILGSLMMHKHPKTGFLAGFLGAGAAAYYMGK